MVLCCPVFGVRVSVRFHLIFVHIIFSLVRFSYVTQTTFFKSAAHTVDNMFPLYFDYL